MFIERIDELRECIKDCRYTDSYGQIESEEALLRSQKLLSGSRTIVIGNGGSAGIASHFCTDLLKTLKLPAMTLCDPTSLTCFSNDYGYEEVFAAPLRILAEEGDLLVAISSSGCSQNILSACIAAKQKGSRVITLSGFDEANPLRELGEVNYWIDSHDYGLVESAHFFLLHTLIDSMSSCKRRSEELMKLATS